MNPDLVKMDCERSLCDPINGFDEPDYVDTCHCRENLFYLIEDLKIHPQRAQDWADIILRNNKGPYTCSHVWHDSNMKSH